MKFSINKTQRLIATLAVVALCGIVGQQQLHASGGKVTTPVDDLGGGTKSGGGSGGGGGGTSTGGGTTTTAPAPITSGTLTFSASGPVNGILPVCIGDYRIDPYYPTLLDMTVNVHVSSLDVPDGTLLYVNVVGSSAVYPFTSNVIAIAAGSGSCTEQIFVYPGTTLTGVIITDVSGNIVFAGN